jgi:hypothetical protein
MPIRVVFERLNSHDIPIGRAFSRFNDYVEYFNLLEPLNYPLRGELVYSQGD